MQILTAEIRAQLRANSEARNTPGHDPRPALKLFNPLGAATWLATELDEDGDTLFGLADLGFGCPEMGYFSLAEIAGVHLPFGLTIERDMAFTTPHPLSRWVEVSRAAGSLLHAERALAHDA
jgi:hypothetical protein